MLFDTLELQINNIGHADIPNVVLYKLAMFNLTNNVGLTKPNNCCRFNLIFRLPNMALLSLLRIEVVIGISQYSPNNYIVLQLSKLGNKLWYRVGLLFLKNS